MRYPYGTPLTPRGPRHLVPVTLSPFASLRVNSAKGLAHRTQRSFAALRMTAGHLSSPLTGSLLSKCLTLSSILDLLSYVQFDGPEVRAIGPVPASGFTFSILKPPQSLPFPHSHSPLPI